MTLAAYAAWQHEYFDNGLQWYAVVTLGGGAVGLLALPVLGSAIDQAGPRRAVRIGLALVGATVLLAVVPARGLQVIALAATGGLGLVGAYLPVITVLNHWFRRRLVIALAALLFALTIAGPIVDFGVPLLADLVDWRLVAVAGGLAAVAAMPALSGAIRDRPEYWGERPDGLAADPEGNVPDYSWREALPSRQFWKLVAAFCCASAVESVGHVYAAPVIVNRGVEVDTIREIRQVDRYLTIPFILVGGLLGYRWPVRYVLSGAAVVATAAIGLMFVAHTLEFLIAILLLAAASGNCRGPGNCRSSSLFRETEFRGHHGDDVAVQVPGGVPDIAGRGVVRVRVVGRLHRGRDGDCGCKFDWRRLVPNAGPAAVIAIAAAAGVAGCGSVGLNGGNG